MKKIFFIFIFLISSCGYQPIYLNKNPDNFIFKKITASGEKKINRKIINSASFIEDSSFTLNNELLINSNLDINETSKNSKVQEESFRTNIVLNFTIKNNGQIIKTKNFTKDFSYNNRESKSELTEYQKEIENNIVNEIIEEIIIYMNL